jgi:dolichol-phosphate mannosyltransferase
MTKLSIVTAFLNEERSLPRFRERVEALAEQFGGDAQFILVDDHSTDGSPQFARQWAETDPRVCYLRLSRNCGSHVALSAGLQHATGDCAVLLATDLQDPPETVPQLIQRWREGNDVVWAVRAAREGEPWTRKASARVYYWLMRRLALPDVPSKGADFVLMDRRVIDAYNAIGEKNTAILAMVLWMGFRQAFVPYVKQARHAGRSKWTLAKKIKLLVDSIVSFSYVPIRAMSLVGLTMATVGFLYAVFVIVGRLAGWVSVGTGFAALMTAVLVGQGIIMLMLGVLGEYVWRAYDEARHRPRYIVEELFQSPQQGSWPAGAEAPLPGHASAGVAEPSARPRLAHARQTTVGDAS